MSRLRLSTILGAALAILGAACGGGAAEPAPESQDATATPAPTAGEEAPAEDAAPAATTELPEPDIDGAEARALVEDGAFLLDVTPAARAEASAIEGRTNIPLPELDDRMDEVPRDRTVIVYCFGGRGSPRAAQMLRDAGYDDVRLLGARARWDD